MTSMTADDVIRHIEHAVAKWVVAGLVEGDQAPAVVRMVHRGYLLLGITKEPEITLKAWCDLYAAALRKVDAMPPAKYAAMKRRLNRAKKRFLVK
jgi:hypothetical protein